MAVDFSSLQRNNFWKKKFGRYVRVRDADGDGRISRADFELVIDRCKKNKVTAPGHVERFTEYMNKFCDSFGLVDDSVKCSYSEFEDKWFRAMKKGGTKEILEKGAGALFHVVDIDEDGFISFEEWTVHYQTLGIDTAHARASFDAIDSNHDQKISADEFVKYHMEFFFSEENTLNSAILFGPLV